jgi:hypothetical protein
VRPDGCAQRPSTHIAMAAFAAEHARPHARQLSA